ncbi:prepilin peptidase [Edwardsiella piscicida]|uniref:prepilin peptidase n=1 Tax=Edwardsiella piscicida TaxID=1263550 RepID=UPI00370D25E2
MDLWLTLAALCGLALGAPLQRAMLQIMRPLCAPLLWHDRHFSPFPCRAALSAALAAISLSLAWGLPPGIVWLCGLGFCTLSLALALIDRASLLLPDALTQPLLWLGLIWNALYQPTYLPQAVFGAAAGYLALWLIAWGFWRWRGEQGLGGGDVKLLSALGAWCGWADLPALLLLASLLTLVGIALRHRWRGMSLAAPAPFGPALLVAGLWQVLPRLAGV